MLQNGIQKSFDIRRCIKFSLYSLGCLIFSKYSYYSGQYSYGYAETMLNVISIRAEVKVKRLVIFFGIRTINVVIDKSSLKLEVKETGNHDKNLKISQRK